MSYKNKKSPFRILAKFTLILFLSNTIAPTLQYTFADSTQYYVDATTGNDTNDGLTSATAWQTISHVNGVSLLQGDTVSLLCGNTWNETLSLSSINGGAGLPITVNGYGANCTTNKPIIGGVSITTSSDIIIDGVSLSAPTVGSSISIANSSGVSVMNSQITNSSGVCMNVVGTTNLNLSSNTLSNCQYGMTVASTEGDIINNIFTNTAQDGITVSGTGALNVERNTLRNVAQNAILFGENTTVTRNTINNACSTSSALCAAIKNDASVMVSNSIITQNTINGVGSGISGDRNYGIYLHSMSGATISQNNIINAEKSLQITNANFIDISGNNLFNPRIQNLNVIQSSGSTVHDILFNSNTLLEKNPDYPYIEIRDEVDGSNMASTFVSANGNTFYPNYKPNTSYIRMVNFGGTTEEYTKSLIGGFDASRNLFEYFAYKPYTNTGSYATANLLSNPTFDADATLWTASADIGLAPTLAHNPSGTYSGGSMDIIPAGGSAERIWATNDAVFSVTAGQTYLVSGYAKSSTGNINLRGFIHSSSDKNIVYSDRIAETYASASGRVFSYYVTIKTTAADAQFSLETSNQNITYEVDSVSVRRMNAVVKNTNANETLIFSNTGATPYNQACPGGVPCAAYVDGVNSTISWPISVPAYTTTFVLWNNSTNILNTPICTLNLSAGSAPTGQPITTTWNLTNSDSQTLHYSTYTGSIDTDIASSGSVTFIPPYDAVTNISIDSINDVGPRQCLVQVTTTNTSPTINPTTTTGSEDAIQIDGTLSGVDLNPGDSIFFEQFGTMPAHGTLNVDSSGSFQFYPNADFCGTDSFEFRAYDQLNHYADPVSQTIQIDCINDTPVVINDATSAYAGTPTQFNVIVNDTDVDSPYEIQTLIIYGYTGALHGTLSVNVNQLLYTPNIGYSGSDILQYSIVDQSGAISNTGTVTVTVTIMNTPPTVSSSGYTINEDITLISSLTGSDLENNPLTYTTTSLPTHGIVTLLSNGNFTYVPDANYFGTDSFDFRVSDGTLFSSSATISITIDSLDDAPMVTNDSYSLNQDTLFFIPVMNNDSDVDSTLLTLTGYTTPLHGTLIVNGTGFDYTPNSGYIGSDSFTYQIIDDTSLTSSSATVSLNVISTNQAPTANSTSFSLNEDAVLTSIVTGSDPENSTLTFILDSSTTNGTLSLSNTGNIVYTPNPDFFGMDSFSFHVSDGLDVSTGVTVSMTINSVNDAPIVSSGSIIATGNNAANSGNVFDGTLTATDIDSIGLSFTATILPVHGLLTMTSTGVYSYTPALGYTGSDSFSYRVSDGIAMSNTGIISITVVDNGSVLVQTLDHYTLSAPTSVTVGQAFTVTVTARDISDITINNYTGAIIFTSPTDTGATLANGGSAINFFLSDNGVKTFTNSFIFTQTGSMTLSVSQSSGVVITNSVTINVVDAVVNTGGGNTGGSSVGSSNEILGGGAVTTNGVTLSPPKYRIVASVVSGESVDIFASAPADENTNTFVLYDPTGLLSQLLLMNTNYLSQLVLNSGDKDSDTGVTSDNTSIIDTLDTLTGSDGDMPIIFREIARFFMAEADESADPISHYEYGIDKVNSFVVEDDSRMSLTKIYVLRIFEQQKKKYQAIIERDANIKTEENE